MLNISKTKSIFPHEAMIAYGFDVLYFDDEPIVFCGFNKNNEYILGSKMSDDKIARQILDIHVVLSDNERKAFFESKKSYRELLDQSKKMYVIEKNYHSEVIDVFKVKTSDIPQDYLPKKDTFYLRFTNEASV